MELSRMISFLQGQIKHLEPTFMVLAVGGVGYTMRISLNTFSFLKDQKGDCTVQTHLHYTQTDGFSLFGFGQLSEKALFLHLISVNGVGPGTALVALSSMAADPLAEAIAREDVKTIQSLKGIGPKTAQRIILELRDKIRKEIQPGNLVLPGAQAKNTILEDALSALITLGIPKPTAEKVLESIVKQADKTYSTEELIRLALKRSN
jgi:Holliday junction DNA helicase RuvA